MNAPFKINQQCIICLNPIYHKGMGKGNVGHNLLIFRSRKAVTCRRKCAIIYKRVNDHLINLVERRLLKKEMKK